MKTTALALRIIIFFVTFMHSHASYILCSKCKNGWVHRRSSRDECSSGWQQMTHMNGADEHYNIYCLLQQTHAVFTHIQWFSLLLYGISLLHVDHKQRRVCEDCHELLIFIIQLLIFGWTQACTVLKFELFHTVSAHFAGVSCYNSVIY